MPCALIGPCPRPIPVLAHVRIIGAGTCGKLNMTGCMQGQRVHTLGKLVMMMVNMLLTVPIHLLAVICSFVKWAFAARSGQIDKQLAMLSAAERSAVTSWLRGAQPDDPLVVITKWDDAALLQLGTTREAVVQHLLANGAQATGCANCFAFRSHQAMARCQLALKTQHMQLFGFSTQAEELAFVQSGGVAPWLRVADTLTVYSVLSRGVAVECEVQFFAF